MMKITLPTRLAYISSKFAALLWLLLLVAGSTQSLRGQASGYNVTQFTQATMPAFTLLPAGKTPAFSFTNNTNIDNGVGTVSLPFPFNFNGEVQNTIYVSLNGFATFGAAPALNDVNPLTGTGAYSGALAPYGHDLDINLASTIQMVHYITVGTAPNRIFKVEWNVRRHTNPNAYGTSDTNNFVFQLWLHETTNVVEFHYNAFAPSNSAVTTFGEVGIRGADRFDFRAFNHQPGTNTNWPATLTVTASCQPSLTATTARMALKGSTLSGIHINGTNSARMLRFTPPTCVAPRAQVSCVTDSQATISWTAPNPAPSNGYDYYVTNTTAVPTGVTTPTGTAAAAATSATITGLSPTTTYYVYIRSKCGADSCWSYAGTVTTACPATAVPYGMFADPLSDSFTVPALPACTSVEQLNTASNAVNWVTQGASMGDGFFDEHLVYNGNSSTANVWYFTQGINLTAGTVYRLSYLYGGSTEFASLTNKMQVAYGFSPCAGSMTMQLADHNNIKASPIESVINFTCTATGTYYFGFRAYSAPNNGKLFLDDIQVVEPGCARVLSASSFSITSSTASFTWPVPSPAPAGGYAYYLSTSATPPAYSQVASGTTTAGNNSVTITGLTANTTYYFWVRSVCGAGDFGEWSAVHSFTTATAPPVSYCTPAPTSVDNLGIVNVTVGSINNSTGAEPGNYGNYSSQITNIAQGQTVTVAITFNTGSFNYNTKIWIDWNNNSLFSDPGENVYTGLSASSSPNTLNATFVVPAGAPLGEHRMRIGGADINDLTGYAAGQGPCYNGSWASFEDYTVNVTVPPPALTISSTGDTVCALSDSPLVTLTSPIGNFNTYSWSPGIGVTGDAVNGWTFNNSSTINYTLTAAQTSFPFATNTVQYRYTANALPTPISLASSSPTACPGTGAQITASGGVVGGLPILEENFNGTAPGWTFTTGTTPSPHNGGNTTGSLWTFRPNGFNPGGSSGVGPMSSNDATQFVISNSDSQGSGTQTNTVIISPVFSLAGYTSASMRFFHYYKPWVNGYARVSISTDGGATYTQILNWGTSFTETQGTPTNFAQQVFSLDPYVGQTNLRVKFDYYTSWGYVWAIDNFLVSGSASSAVTWSPITGLFMDAGLTTPYTAGTGTSVVYASPAATTTYTASASTPAPVCATSTDITITVPTLVIGTVSANQNNCSGVANDITLTGSAGTVIHWESSTDAAFTTPVVIPSSASITLTSAQIGTITGNRWFRAQVQVGGCTVYSNTVAITYVSTTWNGTAWSNGAPNSTRAAVFSGNYSSTGNLQACTCTVLSGNVTFNPGHSFIVQNGVNRIGGSLTFENTASLVQINNSVNSGSITYKRNTTPVRRFDFTYWSSPLSPQTLIGLSPLTLPDKYFSFNTALNTYVNVPGNSLMNPGQGYIIRAPQNFSTTVPAVFNGVFNGGSNDGVPNNGNITVPIVLSGANNFNLLGNPYPSAIDADLFYGANSAVIDGNFYFWTHNTPITNQQYAGSDYAIWNSSGAIGTAGGGTGNTTVPNGNIAAGQGFFVKSISNGTATFTNAMRLINLNNIFYRMSGSAAPMTSEKHRVWLEMTNQQGAYKQTLVGYVEGASNARENAFDADAVEAGNVISFYSLVDENKLSIQGRGLPFTPSDMVPLGYRSSIAGPFQISLSSFDGLFADQDVYLEDAVTGLIHDLKAGPYNFSTESGTFDTRFTLRYTNGTLGVADAPLDSNAVVVYKDRSQLIQIAASGITLKSVQVFDVRGRLLFEANGINAANYTIDGLQAAEQVLLVKVTSADNKQVSKKIIF